MKKLIAAAATFISWNVFAAPTIDDATGVFVSGGSVTSVTTTIDHTDQTNNAIYCSVTIESASETITGVQYDPGGGNQANLTEISSNTAGNQDAEVWAIYEANLPTSATGEQITATFSGSASGKIGCVSFYDANQTAPTSGQISNNSGTGTTLTAGAVTTLVNNDFVFGSFVANCNSCGDVFSSAVGADTNTLQDQDIADSHGAAMTTHQDITAGSVNAGVTFGSSQSWAAASAVITAASTTTTVWTDDTIDVGQTLQGTIQ